MPDETNDDQLLDADTDTGDSEDVLAAGNAAAEAAEADADAGTETETGTGGEEDADSGAGAPELSDEDKEWLKFKETGVSPSQALAYMHRGYEAEHSGGDKKGDAKPGDESESAADDDDYLPVTKKEMRETLKQFAKEAAGSIHAATADATLEQLLETSEYADDETSRGMVKAQAWKLLRGGMKPRQAYKQAQKSHSDWIARQVATTNRKKVAAKRTAGTASAAAPASPFEKLDLEHKPDDFETGAAHDQAVDYMRKAGKLAQ